MNTLKIQIQDVLETVDSCKGHNKICFILRKARTHRNVSDSIPCILVCLPLGEEVKFKKSCLLPFYLHSNFEA